jgi:hypothetical protein
MSRTLRIVAAGLLAVLAPVLAWMALGPGENPLKNAQVGQWIEYVTHTSAMGHDMEMKLRQSVVAKDATSVTMRTETTMMGRKMPPQDVKIALDKAYEPYATGLKGVTVTPLGEGNETLTVGGKPYACHWVKVKIVATEPPMTGTTKVWTSPAVPAGGVVKMETDSTVSAGGQTMSTKMTMEMTGFGG